MSLITPVKLGLAASFVAAGIGSAVFTASHPKPGMVVATGGFGVGSLGAIVGMSGMSPSEAASGAAALTKPDRFARIGKVGMFAAAIGAGVFAGGFAMHVASGAPPLSGPHA